MNGWKITIKGSEGYTLTYNIHEDYTPSRVVMDSDVVLEGMNNKYHVTVVLSKVNSK